MKKHIALALLAMSFAAPVMAVAGDDQNNPPAANPNPPVVVLPPVPAANPGFKDQFKAPRWENTKGYLSTWTGRFVDGGIVAGILLVAWNHKRISNWFFGPADDNSCPPQAIEVVQQNGNSNP